MNQPRELPDGRRWNGIIYLHDKPQAGCTCVTCDKPARNLGHVDGDMIMSRCRRDQGGFLKDTDLEGIAADPRTRLTMLLVRCNGGRFLVPADQCQHFLNIIKRDFLEQERGGGTIAAIQRGADYVRDVSLPAQSR